MFECGFLQVVRENGHESHQLPNCQPKTGTRLIIEIESNYQQATGPCFIMFPSTGPPLFSSGRCSKQMSRRLFTDIMTNLLDKVLKSGCRWQQGGCRCTPVKCSTVIDIDIDKLFLMISWWSKHSSGSIALTTSLQLNQFHDVQPHPMARSLMQGQVYSICITLRQVSLLGFYLVYFWRLDLQAHWPVLLFVVTAREHH